MDNYEIKYLKYKKKYLDLKNILGGSIFESAPNTITVYINTLSGDIKTLTVPRETSILQLKELYVSVSEIPAIEEIKRLKAIIL